MKITASGYYYAAKLKTWLEIGASDQGLRYLNFSQFGASESQNKSNRLIEETFSQLDKYFNGKFSIFILSLDLSGWSDFQKDVWQSLMRIPFGATRSYRDIALEIGRPMACRAVGNANSRNPLPIIVPCHRVIKSDGSLGGYSSGINVKRLLLQHEAAHFEKEPI